MSEHLEEEMVGDREESLVDEGQEDEMKCVRGEKSDSEVLVEAMDTEPSKSRETHSPAKRDGKKKKGKKLHKRRGRK